MALLGAPTLSRVVAKDMRSTYLDLEDSEEVLLLQDPKTYLRSERGRLVVLDEIQRVPDLFPVLRGLIDSSRQEGRDTGQFLILGPASMNLLQQSSESLAGRISYIEMTGLNVLELESGQQDINDLWFRGGYPRSYLARDDEGAMEWLEDLIRTYLERDVPQTGFAVSARKLRTLWTMLAHLQGETINTNNLASNLESSRTYKSGGLRSSMVSHPDSASTSSEYSRKSVQRINSLFTAVKENFQSAMISG